MAKVKGLKTEPISKRDEVARLRRASSSPCVGRVRIEIRQRHHRIDFAAAHVEDDADGCGRAILGEALLQRLANDELDIGVDGKRERRATPAVLAYQRILAALDARNAMVVEVNVPDYVAKEIALGIGAFRGRLKLDAGRPMA